MSKKPKAAAAESETAKNKLSRKERKNMEFIQYAKQKKEQSAWEEEEAKDLAFMQPQPVEAATKTAEAAAADKKKKTKKKKKPEDKKAEAAPQEVRY